RQHTKSLRDWSSDVCSSDLVDRGDPAPASVVDRVRDVGRAMATTQPSELTRLEALGAERDAVDPGPGEGPRVATFVGAGVRLDQIGRASCRERGVIPGVAWV